MHREKNRRETKINFKKCFETDLYLLYSASLHRLLSMGGEVFLPSLLWAEALYLLGPMLPDQLSCIIQNLTALWLFPIILFGTIHGPALMAEIKTVPLQQWVIVTDDVVFIPCNRIFSSFCGILETTEAIASFSSFCCQCFRNVSDADYWDNFKTSVPTDKPLPSPTVQPQRNKRPYTKVLIILFPQQTLMS